MKAISATLLALLGLATVSAKGLRGGSTSALEALREKSAGKIDVLRKLQEDGADDGTDTNNNNNDNDGADDGATGGAAGGANEEDGDDDNIDVAVLQFALNLEYLEAEFYSWAAYGVGISDCTNTTGGQKANLTAPYQAIAAEIANNELAHVRLIQSVLGNNTVECPALNLGDAFSTAANVAFNTTLEPPYSPYYDDLWFTLGAFIFEDVGVTAYNGAATLVESDAVLQAAAGILAVEAYHAGIVRHILYMNRNELLTPYPVTVEAGVQAVSDLRAAVGGGKDSGISGNRAITAAPTSAPSAAESTPEPTSADDDDEEDAEPVLAPPDTLPSGLVPADENAVAFARTTDEVLAIVYLGDAKVPGGFYPQGLNGAIA